MNSSGDILNQTGMDDKVVKSYNDFEQKNKNLNYFKAIVVAVGGYYMGYYISMLNDAGLPYA